MTILKKLFGGDRHRDTAFALYGAAVAQSRTPEFYTEWGVPDTVEGRFDMSILYVHTILRRLKGQGATTDSLAQAIFDVMFEDVDQNLRLLGVGDMRIGKKVKDMGASFYGRIGAYDAALADDAAPDALEKAVRRNVYLESEEGDASALAAHMRGVYQRLQTVPIGDLLAGKAGFDEAAS